MRHSREENLELFDRAVPVHPSESWVPVSGTTAAARHASYTGATSQTVQVWTEKQSALLQVIQNSQGIDDYELASVLQWPHGSVNSIRNSVEHLLQPDGFNVHTWRDARGHERSTKRTRWVIR